MIIENKIPISNSEAKNILMKKMKEKELNYEQQLAYEYLKNTTKLSKTDADKLIQELQGMGIKNEQLINISNILPEDEQTLKLILNKNSVIKTEKLKDILKIIKNYR